MSIQAIIDNYLSGGILAVILCGAVVQIAPVKIYPVSWLFKVIGRLINAELTAKVDAIEKKFDAHIKADEVSKVGDIRQKILDFDAESCRGLKHTEEQYNQIIEHVDFYESYCESHKEYKNNKAITAISNIKDRYKNDKLNNDFL